MTTETLAALEAALNIILIEAPDHLRETAEVQRALRAGSPILRQRFTRLAENAAPDLSPEARQQVAAVLAELTAPRPGPVGRGNEYRLLVFLTAAEKEALADYVERAGANRAEVVRRGLAAVVPNWPDGPRRG